MQKTTDKDSVVIGEPFTYELRIKNLGPAIAYNITLTDTLPSNISVSDFHPEADSIIENILIWKFDSLDVNDEISVTFKAIVNQTLTDSIFSMYNIAVVHAPGDTNIVGKKARRRIVVVDDENKQKTHYNLGLTKSTNKDTVYSGEEFVYTLTIKNYGPDTAYHIMLTDTLPDLITNGVK